jgi:protein-S-isoprenylcysteine O-methyltransferase Ste14
MTATQTDSTSVPSVLGTADLNTTALPGSVAALVILHAICLGGSFVILFPLGVSLLRFFNSFRLHWILQVIATLICIIGLAVAVALSVMDVEYNSFTAVHQIIGILVVAVLVLQVVLGYMHHKKFKKVGGRTWVSYAHLWTGRAVVIVGMVNAVLYVTSPSHISF